ncbi:MAG: hypothetical protein R3C56_21825 [Pirellulaceae bacterium]
MSEEEKTRAFIEGEPLIPSDTLLKRYKNLLHHRRVQWTTYHRFVRELGSGGQGIVYLSERKGQMALTSP